MWVSEEAYADLMANEVLDVQDLAGGAEIQRRIFNLITPLGLSWLQPMFPSVAPSTPSSLTPQRNASLGQTLARLAHKFALFCLACRGRLCLPLKIQAVFQGFSRVVLLNSNPVIHPTFIGVFNHFSDRWPDCGQIEKYFRASEGVAARR